MAAYYNEIDKFCVERLKEFIKAGLITPGDVDSRSICDVKPDDLKGYTPNATSSPALAVGRSRCAGRVGRTKSRFIQAPARVSRSHVQVSAKRKKTRGTSGRCFTNYLTKTPRIRLASRLAKRLALIGSMEYVQTWSARRCSSGWLYWSTQRRRAAY